MKNSFGTLMKIVEYKTANNIIVEFQDEYKFRKATNYANFKMGRVKNSYDKTIFGVGCLGNGKHGSWKNSRNSRDTYLVWVAMLQRCYIDMNGKYSAYYGVATVCDEWLNFQNFAKWYEDNYYSVPYERMHVDKDIKYNGNKIYGPDTCIIVPQKINELFHRSKKKVIDSDLPETIRRHNKGYQVSFRRENLGVYDTVDECLEKYNNKKIEYIKELVKEYGNFLPNDVSNILLNWKP